MRLMGHAREESTLIYDHLRPEYVQSRLLAYNRELLAEADRRAVRYIDCNP